MNPMPKIKACKNFPRIIFCISCIDCLEKYEAIPALELFLDVGESCHGSFIQRAVLGWLSVLSPMFSLLLTLIKNLLFKGVEATLQST